ncbi:GGDEF domain-containing protein [Parasphingorhabdus sp.]
MMVVILGLFSIVFAIIFTHDRTQRFAGWLAFAFLSGLCAFLVDISRAALDPVLSDIASKLLFWGFSTALVMGVFKRFQAAYPFRILGLTLGIGLAGLMWFSFGNADIIYRSIVSSITAGLIMVWMIPILWKERRGRLGMIMLALVAILCATYFLRPIIVYGMMDATHTAATYQNSAYATILHVTSAICGLACGVTMLIVVGHDVIEKYQRANTTDPLTGLMNRRGLEKYVTSEMSGRAAQKSVVIIADLDEFKQVNDLFGHEAGDHVLKRTGAVLDTVTSQLGKVARIGGEEFVIILNHVSFRERNTIAEHIRLSIAAIVHPEIGLKERVTASLGMAVVAEGESFSMALRRADFAMYKAKADGRNCVVDTAESDNIGIAGRSG